MSTTTTSYSSASDLEQEGDVVRGRQVGAGRLPRREQDVEAEGRAVHQLAQVLRERAVLERRALRVVQPVEDGVRVARLQGRTHLAELQVEVEKDDPAPGGDRGRGQVRGQEGLAAPAARRADRDDGAGLRRSLTDDVLRGLRCRLVLPARLRQGVAQQRQQPPLVRLATEPPRHAVGAQDGDGGGGRALGRQVGDHRCPGVLRAPPPGPSEPGRGQLLAAEHQEVGPHAAEVEVAVPLDVHDGGGRVQSPAQRPDRVAQQPGPVDDGDGGRHVFAPTTSWGVTPGVVCFSTVPSTDDSAR